MLRKNILVLESDPDFLAFLERVFSETRYHFIAVDSFKEAFSKIKTLAPTLALVILDFELATDDVEILERQRRLDFDEPIPVLMMGNVMLSSDEIVQLCSDSGYTGYVCRKMAFEDWVQVVNTMAMGEDPTVFFPVEVVARFSGLAIKTECFSLNAKGAFIKLGGPYPEAGAKGSIAFLHQGQVFLEAKSEVVFVRPFQPDVVSVHPSGVGLKFVGLETSHRQLLETLIRKKKNLDDVQ